MSGHISPIKQRLVIRYGKYDALKYTSTLDIAKVWERVLRRADLPVLYTQGFNTRPRIQPGTQLPIGLSSECELMDVSLRQKMTSLDGIPQQLEAVSPGGLKVYTIHDVDPAGPALQTLVRSAWYRIHPVDDVELDAFQAKIADVLAAEHIIKVKERVRKGKVRRTSTDLRTMIYDLHLNHDDDLIAHLAAGERGNLQPFDLLAEMGYGDVLFHAHRYKIEFDEYYERLLNYTEANS